MRNNIQAELWYRITGNLNKYDGIYKKCRKARMIEDYQHFEDMRKKFEASLPADQKESFNTFVDCVENLISNSQDEGIALGFCIMQELQRFLADPASAFQQATYPFTMEKDSC